MTEADIKQYIESHITGKTGSAATVSANISYRSALSALGRLDAVPWNKRVDTFSLTSGTGDYVLGRDVLTDHQDIRGLVSLWRIDTENWQVPIVPHDEFNHHRRGNTDTGEPYCATLMNNSSGELTLYFYKIPDSTYPLWARFYIPLNFTDIPDEYKELVAVRGVMKANSADSGYYQSALRDYMEIMDQLTDVSYRRWDGTIIKPDVLWGSARGDSRSHDSGNLFGYV